MRMIHRRYLLLIPIFISMNLKGICQDYNFNLPSFVPPSPGAASLIKSGSTNVSLATGTVNINIPLYSFGGTKLTLPLSASYAANGVRINDVSNLLGMGWNLNFGGVVTRTVLGLPDEEREGDTLSNFNAPSLTTLNESLLNYLDNSIADKESDIFNFQCLGLSGSFYLDADIQPVLLGKANYKIRKHGSLIDDGFELTDDKGIRYYFTEAETTYKTNSGGGQACKNFYGDNDFLPMTTAWYLSKIRITARDSIVFSYQDVTRTYQGEVSQNITKTIGTAVATCGGGAHFEGCPLYQEVRTTCISHITNMLKYPSQIAYYDGSRVTFDYDTTGIPLLNRMEVYNHENILSRRLLFTRSTIESTVTTGYTSGLGFFTANKFRQYLTKIADVNVLDTTQKQEYTFEYDDPAALPPRLSFAQDHWGYFNGENNSELLPSLEYGAQKTYFDGHDGNIAVSGNREPSAAYMTKGILNKVSYPTGGHDSLLYKPVYGIKNEPVPQTTAVTITATNGEDWSEPDIRKDTIYIPFNQKVRVDCGCVREVTPPDFHGACTFQILPLTDTALNYFSKNISAVTGASSDSAFLPAGYYVLSARGTWDSTVSTMLVTYQHDAPLSIPHQKLIGGISIDEIRSYTRPGELAGTKKYYYNSIAGSDSFVYRRLYDDQQYYSWSSVVTRIPCDASPTWETPYVIGMCTYINLNGSFLNAQSVLGASPFYFSDVRETELNAAGTPNGYTLHHYRFADDYDYTTLPTVVHGSLVPGLPFPYVSEYVIGESETTVFKYTGSGYAPVKKKRNEYGFSMPSFVTNHLVKRKYQSLFAEEFINAFDVNTYKLFTSRIRLDRTDELDYAGDDSLKNTTYFYYDNDNYVQPTRIVSQNSEGESIRTTSKYPHDLSGAVYDTMVSRNMIGKITESKVSNLANGKTISWNRNNYSLFGSSPNIASQQSFNRTDSSWFTELTVHNFSDANNILDYTPISGQLQSMIWNYNESFPVAQVTGAAFASIAYAGFEATEKGNWDYSSSGSRSDSGSITGIKAFTLSTSSIQRTALETGKTYIISYWLKNNGGTAYINGASGGTAMISRNGWTLYQREIQSVTTITLTGTGVVDELRLYPNNAQMTTYAYDPVVGITTQCDTNNRITYYEYDGFHRLHRILDQDRNILKTFEYGYKQTY
jgi:hypothetical protein